MINQKLKNEYNMKSVQNDVKDLFNKYSAKLIDNIIANASQVATACKMKTITIGHLNTVNQIQLKSIGSYPNVNDVQTGGSVTMPIQFFGGVNNAYNVNDGNCRDAILDSFYNLPVDVAKYGIHSTFPPTSLIDQSGGGGITTLTFIEESDFIKQLKSVKEKYKVKITKEAIDIIRLSIELNFDMLLKFLQKKRIKHLNAEKIHYHVEKNNRRFRHFVSKN